jgi:hypothetical protein
MSNSSNQVHHTYEGASGLLSRLTLVRKRSANQWSARCPAHEDKGPSLSVKELPDGRVLLHCFAGCAAIDVLGAIGLDFSSLFPERTEFQSALKKPRLLTATQALELLSHESLIVSIVAHDIGVRKKFKPEDLDRVAKAYGRIAALRNEVNS